MWFYNILSAVIAIIVAVAALYLLFRLFVLKQGNENIVLLAKRATNFQVSDRSFESITLFCDKPRKGGTIRVYVTLTGKTGNIREDIKGFPYMDIDIYYQIVGRTDYHIDKQRIRLTAEEVQAAMVQ